MIHENDESTFPWNRQRAHLVGPNYESCWRAGALSSTTFDFAAEELEAVAGMNNPRWVIGDARFVS